MANEPAIRADEPDFDHNVDRFPNLEDVLVTLQHDPRLQESQVERLEITLAASGEATARVFAPRAEEPDVLYWRKL
jgi:hypothetical protein